MLLAGRGTVKLFSRTSNTTIRAAAGNICDHRFPDIHKNVHGLVHNWAVCFVAAGKLATARLAADLHVLEVGAVSQERRMSSHGLKRPLLFTEHLPKDPNSPDFCMILLLLPVQRAHCV